MTTKHKMLFKTILPAGAIILAAIIGAHCTSKNTASIVATRKIETIAPTVKLFPVINTKKPEIQQLGDWQACLLVVAGESHANQACTCLIERSPKEEGWQLRVVNVDSSVDGICNCRAGCFNGLADSDENTQQSKPNGTH